MFKKYYCPYCNKETEVHFESRREVYPVKGEDIYIDSTVCVCTECNADLFVPEIEDENLKKAYTAYRLIKKLLLPEEIRRLREKYGLSQSAFAKILGMGEKTITRYENGSLQDEVHNNLLFLIKDESAFMRIFEKNKCKLSQSELKASRWYSDVTTVKYSSMPHIHYSIDSMDYGRYPTCKNEFQTEGIA